MEGKEAEEARNAPNFSSSLKEALPEDDEALAISCGRAVYLATQENPMQRYSSSQDSGTGPRTESPQDSVRNAPRPAPSDTQDPNQKSWIQEHPWWTLIIVLIIVFLVAYLISKSSFCRDKDGKKKDSVVCNVASDIASVPEGIVSAVGGAFLSIVELLAEWIAALGGIWLAIRLVRFFGGRARADAFRSREAIKEAVDEGRELTLEFTEDGKAFWAETDANGEKIPLELGGEVVTLTDSQLKQAKEVAEAQGNTDLVEYITKVETVRAANEPGAYSIESEKAKKEMEEKKTLSEKTNEGKIEVV